MHHEAYVGLKTMIEESSIDYYGRHIGDFGGRNINGAIRDLMPTALWSGIDLVEGPDVDYTCDLTLDWPEGYGTFDIIVSTELLEHVEDWRSVIRTMTQALSPNGLEMVFITCASTGRRSHGASGEMDPPPGEWYQNVEPDALERQLAKYFSHYEVKYNPHPGDVYAWAQCVKR